MSSKSLILDVIRESYPNYHPLVSIAHIAHDTSSDPRLRFDCHKAIAKYVEPELKSLEVRGVFEDDRRVIVSLFDEIADATILEPDINLSIVDKLVDEY